MRVALLAGAVAISLGLPMTAAHAASAYAKIEGGAIFQSDLDFGAGLLDMGAGYSFGVGFGWHLSAAPVVIETEVFYAEAQHDLSSATLGGLSAMANALYTIGDMSGLRVFVGAGVGMDQVSYYGEDTPIGISDSDWVGSWQGILGVAHKYGDVDVQVRYRYHDTFSNADLNVGPASALRETEWNHHNITLGLVFGL